MLYLIRHGETEWNRQRRIQGWGDSPLTAKGQAQARAVGALIKRVCANATELTVISSPLGRTLWTARLVAEAAGIDATDIATDPRLREISFGDFEGLSWPEFETNHAEFFAAWRADSWSFQMPGGESSALVAERVGAWLTEHSFDRPALVVTHGITGRILRGLYKGIDWEDMRKLSIAHEELHLLADGAIETFAAEIAE